jgi:hypothetical protein
MPRTLAMAALGVTLWVSTARADGYRLQHTIPRLVPGYDSTTGGEFRAPPVPYGHYAKTHLYNPHELMGCVSCRLRGLLGCCGGGLGHHGAGCGDCGGTGCGHCGGGGLFGHHGGGSACLVPGCGGGPGCGHHGAGRFGPGDWDCGPAVAGSAQSLPSGVAVVQPSGQACGQPGCGVEGLHSHKGHRRCGLCGGRGCGGCGGSGLGGCGDPGCGLCHGGGHGFGSGLHARLAGLLRHQRVDYFLGAGGPVPLTPGYVPYVVVTRSPRDFFAFPPMNPLDP